MATVYFCSIHPQGWVPIETDMLGMLSSNFMPSSIHPQGWVPIETSSVPRGVVNRLYGSIHPQGWVPIETGASASLVIFSIAYVAFTPKGGCPLKHPQLPHAANPNETRSIHPQGWVPIETLSDAPSLSANRRFGSIHPQGWVPIETCAP